ncbi:MAG TPA: efflux transporter outer membrane subunit [Steroidobacteraceae bacterium]|nr:efflux transporter outer membrane subunit [Steroidobacteraceae bacterium]
MKRVRLAAVSIILSAALSACSFAPRYATPQTAPAPQAYQGSADWKPAQPADAQYRGQWWENFGDPELNALEARVTVANQNLKAAFARLQQARAQTRIARAAYFPTITAGPSVTRARTSLNSPTYNNTKPQTGNDFVLDADLSYEIDVWGRVRNSVASARASEQASAADLATLDLSTHAELASDFFQLRSQDAQQELLDSTVVAYGQALELTQSLYDGGAGLLSDVDQAKAQLETARTQAADMRLNRAQSAHAIAVLLGESATTFTISPRPLPVATLPPPFDPGLPSALLERRPDVAAAERRVAAANSQIGVARAAYFPVFSLLGAIGFESTTAGSWITAPSRMWSIGPSAIVTALDGGLHRAQAAQAHAAYDEQVADYRNTVLTAYQEVEDNLSALHDLELESISESAAVVATAAVLEQAQYRYEGGETTYLEVVTAENAALAARLAAANIQLRRMTASVLLVKALGGGWHNP